MSAALVGVSAGYSNPDLRASIGDMVNGIFVSDFAASRQSEGADPDDCSRSRRSSSSATTTK